MSAKTVLKLAVVATALGLGLAGCGRRGDLEPAPDSGVSARAARSEPAPMTPTSMIGAPATPKANGIVKPKEPFILDPLL